MVKQAFKRVQCRPVHRRGIALAEVLMAGLLLAIGIAAFSSISTRSLAAQTDGEYRMTAAWLADDLLQTALATSPERIGMLTDSAGQFDAPFNAYSYELVLEDLGRGVPFRARAIVTWGPRPGDRIEVETLIAVRLGEEDEDPPREPEEPVDREERWLELDGGEV